MLDQPRSPDEAKIKNKMLYASSKDALRRALVGIAVEIQGTDFSEVAYESGTSASYTSDFSAPIYKSLSLNFDLTSTRESQSAINLWLYVLSTKPVVALNRPKKPARPDLFVV